MIEHIHDSNRYVMRREGVIERPTMGFAALPLMVNPWYAGELRSGSMFILGNNRRESPAAAYAGLFLVFVAVPFAWRVRRWRGAAFFWLAIAVFGVGQVLGIPILKQIEELPPLTMLSSNRLTCLTALATTILGSIGLAAILRRKIPPARLWSAPLLLPAAMACYLLWRLVNRYELIKPVLDAIARGSGRFEFPREQMLRIVDWFETQYWWMFALSAAAGVMYFLLACPRAAKSVPRSLVGLLVVLCVAEATLVAWPNMDQADRKWYPSNPPIIEKLKSLPPGRIVGAAMLKPDYSMYWSVEDARGYDGADPLRITQLLLRAEEGSGMRLSEASLMNWSPGNWNLLSMLNVRYVIFAAELPGAGPPVLKADKLYIYENPRVLPRAYVPRAVRPCNDAADRLNILSGSDFSAWDLALSEGDGAPALEQVEGTAKVTRNLPCAVEVQVDMKTPGVVVLADSFAPGWVAAYQGAPTKIYCVNHALRGVSVPAGRGVIEFEYRPSSLHWGLVAMAAGLVMIVAALASEKKGQWKKDQKAKNQ